MKVITCDLCKKEMGFNLVLGNTEYRVNEFDSGFYCSTKTHSDLCPECYGKICEAQKKAIEEIIKLNQC